MQTNNSQRLYERALRSTIAGVHSNSRAREPHPLYFARADGPHLWDVDDNRYIDRNNDRHSNKRSRSRSRDGGKGKDSNRDRRGEEVVDRNDYRGSGRDERRDKGIFL